jgi:hypothetical protein
MKIETTPWVGLGGPVIWPIIKILCNSINIKDAHLIDMGCGCGVLGLHAIEDGYASTAVLCDIDHEAVMFTNKNIISNGYQHCCTAIQTDTWDCISTKQKIYDKKKFNLMVASLPLTRNADYVPPSDINPLRQVDINYQFHLRLAEDLSSAMESGAFLIMCDFLRPPAEWARLMDEKCRLITTLLIPNHRLLWKNNIDKTILKYIGNSVDGIDVFDNVNNLADNHIVMRLWQVK